jgi:hypothetical protein
MKTTYEVNLYYSSFCTYEIEAENEKTAILNARKLSVIQDEILSNIESWKEADSVMEINTENSITY